MLTDKVPYKDPETDYEEMLIKKNAPRWITALKKYGYIQGDQIQA